MKKVNFGWDLAGVMVGLLLFGIGYNALVAKLEREGYTDGYTALLVVGGTLITVLGVTIVIGIEAAVQVTLCFVASGTPMILGSIVRYSAERRATLEEMRRLAREKLGEL